MLVDIRMFSDDAGVLCL